MPGTKRGLSSRYCSPRTVGTSAPHTFVLLFPSLPAVGINFLGVSGYFHYPQSCSGQNCLQKKGNEVQAGLAPSKTQSTKFVFKGPYVSCWYLFLPVRFSHFGPGREVVVSKVPLVTSANKRTICIELLGPNLRVLAPDRRPGWNSWLVGDECCPAALSHFTQVNGQGQLQWPLRPARVYSWVG